MQSKGSVLVVDDEIGARESMKMILGGRFDVSTTDSGYKAIQLVKEKNFDVVILDIRMPDISGIEVLQRIKENESSPEVMMVTAYAALDTAKDAMRLGAYDYMEKPFKSFDEFREVVSRGVERKMKAEKVLQLARDFDEVRKQLLQLEKLSSLGQIASEVMHELATPITGVLGYSEFLLDQECDGIIKNSLVKIRSEAERCQTMIRNVLMFARKPENKKRPTNINEIITRTIDIKAHQIRLDSIELSLVLDPELPIASVDFSLIQQVIINIVGNAQDVLRKHDGERKISVKTKSDSKYIYIAISNTGPHIPKEHLEMIFEPYFTTKSAENGTGLGLSISRDILHSHKGDITIQNNDEIGVTFTIKLPLGEELSQLDLEVEG